MPEKLEDILKNGFYLWRKNPNISVPFLLDLIAGIIVTGIFFVLAVLLLIFLLLPVFSISDISELSFYINKFNEIGISAILLFILLVIAFLIVLQLINSFFYAGAIGMAKTAIENGNTKISDMLDYGKRKFPDLFFANLIISLVYFLGILLFLPFLLSIFFIKNILSLILVLLGVIGIIAYMIVASIVLSPVSYTVVISNTKATDGIKKGFRFFMDNKMDVFLLWFLMLLISIATGIFTGLFQFIAELMPVVGWLFSILIGLISAVISILIISPLSTVWWARLYMGRKRV